MKTVNGPKRLLPWLTPLLLGSLLAACGGGGQDPLLGGIQVTAKPTVVSVTPGVGATQVALHTQIVTVSFSKPMDPASLLGTSLTLQCPAGGTSYTGTVSYNASNNTAILTLPATPTLPANTVCQAVVTTGAKDSSGAPLDISYTWSFTTSATADVTAPSVSSTINADGAINVPTNTHIGATFSEALRAASVGSGQFLVKQTLSNTPVVGALRTSGSSVVFTPGVALLPSTQYTVTVKGGVGGVADLAANVMTSDYVWKWTTAAVADLIAPTISSVSPANATSNVPVSSAINATFNEAMDPLTLNNASFTLQGASAISGVVSVSAGNTIATFTPNAALSPATTYTASISTAATDLAGNPLALQKVWSFTTAAIVVLAPTVNLAAAAPFGSFGGSAGMTNTGTLTLVNGDMGSIATATTSITGLHDTAGDIYTETLANIGSVNGKIYSCTNSVTGPNSTGPSAPACAIATQARLDAQTAYLALVAMPVGGASPAPGANLASLTLLPGVYKSASGDFMVQGGDLTLDAQGDANATWVFQMASTLTVGGPGAAFPQSIVLTNGAQAKNVFWQVGTFATINAAGGGTMVGTIISQAGAAFSTVGNVSIVYLNGRVLSLGASVTVVDTVITVPAP